MNSNKIDSLYRINTCIWFAFSIQVSFYILKHCFGVLKNFVFDAFKRKYVYIVGHIQTGRYMRKVINKNNRKDKVQSS